MSFLGESFTNINVGCLARLELPRQQLYGHVFYNGLIWGEIVGTSSSAVQLDAGLSDGISFGNASTQVTKSKDIVASASSFAI